MYLKCQLCGNHYKRLFLFEDPILGNHVDFSFGKILKNI